MIRKAAITKTEEIVSEMIQRCKEPMEFGWYYGSSEDGEYFTSVYIPLSLGILETVNGNNFHGATWDDKIRRRTLHKLLGDTYTVIISYLAIRPDTRELGVQLISRTPEDETGFKNSYTTFFPMEQLILIRDLSEYLPKDARGMLTGMSEEQIYELILRQKTSQNTLDNLVRIDRPLLVGQYSLRQSYMPNNNAIISILRDNVVDQGVIIGTGHLHYLKTEKDREETPNFKEWDEMVGVEEVEILVPGEAQPRKIRVGHERYMSPSDANEILLSKENIKEISRGNIESQEALKAIFVIDPETRQIVKTMYFDAIELSQTAEERRKFREYTAIAGVTTDPEMMKKFYGLIKKYTKEEPPAVMDVGY